MDVALEIIESRSVLILVLVDFTTWQVKKITKEELISVLILVLVDFTTWQITVEEVSEAIDRVLILVLVDFTTWQIK